MDKEFEINSEICKVDSSLGIVFGWAIVCKKNGVDYFDLQGDHITETGMLEASAEYMLNSRIAKDMHVKGEVLPGSVVFAFPLTSEISKSFGIETSKTGLLIGMKPDDAGVLRKFSSGEYKGFSIGGHVIEGSED